jgi:hypothetical protein
MYKKLPPTSPMKFAQESADQHTLNSYVVMPGQKSMIKSWKTVVERIGFYDI